jgi:hypothetical protein
VLVTRRMAARDQDKGVIGHRRRIHATMLGRKYIAHCDIALMKPESIETPFHCHRSMGVVLRSSKVIALAPGFNSTLRFHRRWCVYAVSATT